MYNCADSLKGRPRISTALTRVNTVALMPIPSASAMMATAEYQRSRAMTCRAKRRSRNMILQLRRRRFGGCRRGHRAGITQRPRGLDHSEATEAGSLRAHGGHRDIIF